MANAFKKAKDAAAATPEVKVAKSKKETLWLVGNDPVTGALAEAVTQMVKAHNEAKALETQVAVYKTRLLTYALGQWQQAYGSGNPPETPMKVVNRETGESVTLVIQDRSQGHKVTDDVLATLTGIIGPAGIAEAVFEQDQFSFDPVVMAAPCANDPNRLVQDVVGEEIGKMQDRLVKAGILTQKQADDLLIPDIKRTYRPGFLVQLPRLCAFSVSRFVDCLGVIGSAVVKYVRA